MSGRLLALTIVVVTAALITIGTLWPIQSAAAMAGHRPASTSNGPSGSNSAQAAAQNLMQLITPEKLGRRPTPRWQQGEFTETEFVRDLTGSYASLRTYATLDGFDLSPFTLLPRRPQFQASLNWSSVVGTFQDVRDLASDKSRRPLAGGLADQPGP